MLKVACTKSEASCLIGNLFVELMPPCDICGQNDLIIKGKTYSNAEAVVVIRDYGFDFYGVQSDIESIRKKECQIEKSRRIHHHYKGKIPCKTHIYDDKRKEVSEKV